MGKLVSWLIALISIDFVPAIASAQNGPSSASHWPTETLTRRDGRVLRGLVQAESAAEVEFVEVVRPPGKPMYLVVHSYPTRSVTLGPRLAAAQRRELFERIGPLLETKSRLRIEAARMEDLVTQPFDDDGRTYRSVVGAGYRLLSTADEETTRRCAVRVDQIFRAYRQVLPPRVEPRGGLRIVVFGSTDEYRGFLQRIDGQAPVENAAFYSATRNTIVCGSDLSRYQELLQQTREHNAQLARQLQRLGPELTKRLKQVTDEMRRKGFTDAEVQQEVELRRTAWRRQSDELQARIDEVQRRNDAKFREVTEQMFTRLYHEAFHAYVDHYVYPSDVSRNGAGRTLPRWLNEGLAQIFESGQLEGDTLRIDAPATRPLKRLQAELASGSMLPLADVLTARQETFLVTHADAGSARHYAYSWGLAYYLTFHRNLLLGRTLDDYVADSSDPVPRFERLIGSSLREFEAVWREAVQAAR